MVGIPSQPCPNETGQNLLPPKPCSTLFSLLLLFHEMVRTSRLSDVGWYRPEKGLQSKVLTEVQQICEWVGAIHDGKLVSSNTRQKVEFRRMLLVMVPTSSRSSGSWTRNSRAPSPADDQKTATGNIPDCVGKLSLPAPHQSLAFRGHQNNEGMVKKRLA